MWSNQIQIQSDPIQSQTEWCVDDNDTVDDDDGGGVALILLTFHGLANADCDLCFVWMRFTFKS